MSRDLHLLEAMGYIIELGCHVDGNPCASYVRKDGVIHTFVCTTHEEAISDILKEVMK